MAVIIINDLPPEVTPEQYLEVGKILDGQDDPDGFIFHSGIQVGDHIRVIDAWESAEHFGAFAQNQLAAAIGQVMGGEMGGGGMPQPEVHEALDLATSS